jgi:hypothetical protein
MLKRLVPLLIIASVAATSAHAQYGGGGGGGGRGGGGGGGHGHQPSSNSPDQPAPAPAPPPPKPPKPMNTIEIVGVVQAIDASARRVTIAYDAVDELGWPHGTMQFGVYKADLLKTVKVGERVRFKLDSQQISELTPY